jgi:hypothetical protein
MAQQYTFYCNDTTEHAQPVVIWQPNITTLGALRAAVAAIGSAKILCSTCGHAYVLQDNITSVVLVDAPIPRIDSLSPLSGTANGGTTVTIVGRWIDAPGLVVKFNGVTATIQGGSVSSTQCMVTTPAGALGLVDVTVSGTNGMRGLGGTLHLGYQYT